MSVSYVGRSPLPTESGFRFKGGEDKIAFRDRIKHGAKPSSDGIGFPISMVGQRPDFGPGTVSQRLEL